MCVREGGGFSETIVFLQYVTHKRVAETNISKQVKREVFGLFFIFGYYKYQYSTGLRAKRCLKVFFKFLFVSH